MKSRRRKNGRTPKQFSSSGRDNTEAGSGTESVIERQPEDSDRRFEALKELAREGNENAVRDLWLEYSYEFLVKIVRTST